MIDMDSKCTVLNGRPQLCRILFRQRHYALRRSVSQKVGFFNTVDEGVMYNLPVSIQSHQLFIRPLRKM